MLYLSGERGADNELVKLENENWEQNLTQYDTSHSKKLIVSKLHLQKLTFLFTSKCNSDVECS